MSRVKLNSPRCSFYSFFFFWTRERPCKGVVGCRNTRRVIFRVGADERSYIDKVSSYGRVHRENWVIFRKIARGCSISRRRSLAKVPGESLGCVYLNWTNYVRTLPLRLRATYRRDTRYFFMSIFSHLVSAFLVFFNEESWFRVLTKWIGILEECCGEKCTINLIPSEARLVFFFFF